MDLGELYKKALEKTFVNQITVYDYATDFETLWKKDSQGAPAILQNLKDNPLMIVWDGNKPQTSKTPGNADVLLEKHLTPLDWALSLSIQAIEDRKVPSISIHLIDITAGQFEEYWAIRMRYQILADMPWIRLYTPLKFKFDNYELFLIHENVMALDEVNIDETIITINMDKPSGDGENDDKLSNISFKNKIKRKLGGLFMDLGKRWISSEFQGNGNNDTNEKNSSDTSTNNDPKQFALFINRNGSWIINENVCDKTIANCTTYGLGTKLKNLAAQWASSLIQSNDHHDINNVIGPDIIAKGESERAGMPGAFLNRLSWSGIKLDESKNWTPWEAEAAARNELFGNSISVLVVDDNLQQGWGRFVCRLFGNQQFDEDCVFSQDNFSNLNKNNPKIRIQGCLTAKPIIQFLEKADFMRRNFSSQITDGRKFSEIILLDLRLYTDETQARECLKNLLSIFKKKIENSDQERLAWPKISLDEIQAINDWLNGSPVGLSFIPDQALLLLPKLLSLALPITPIILFSSTGQARLREPLKSYQNIFTGFEKPRVLSSPDMVLSSILILKDELEKAVKMMRLRLQLAHAQRAIELADTYKIKNVKGKLTNQYIELFADETFSLEEGIASGLAVCIYPNENVSDELQDCFLYEFVNSGVVWARYKKFQDPKLKKASKIDSENIKEQVDLLTSLLNSDHNTQKNNRYLWSIVGTRVEGIVFELKNVSLAAFPDGSLDDALRYNLEFILFVLIPFFTKEGNDFNGNVSIYLPSRDVHLTPASIEESKNIEEFASTLSENFGLALRSEPLNNGTDQCKSNADSGTEITLKKQIITTFGSDTKKSKSNSIFPLVRGWLHEWKLTTPNVLERISKIKLTILGDPSDPNKSISLDAAMNRRLFHDIGDWACAFIKPNKKARILSDALKEKQIFHHWFVNGDCAKSPLDYQEWFIKDSQNSMTLMRALRATFTAGFQDNSRSDILRIVLRNTYIVNIDERLLKNEHCIQQRMILWVLKESFFSSKGQDLHVLLENLSEKGTVSKVHIKGYGFIKPDCGRSIFFHFSNVVLLDKRRLQEGDRVKFEIADGRKGPEARNVRLI